MGAEANATSRSNNDNGHVLISSGTGHAAWRPTPSLAVIALLLLVGAVLTLLRGRAGDHPDSSGGKAKMGARGAYTVNTPHGCLPAVIGAASTAGAPVAA